MLNVAVFQVLTVLAAAAPAAVEKNPVLVELVEKGVPMPDGSLIKLPSPTMTAGMDAKAQAAAMTKVLPPRCSLEAFTEKNSKARIALKIRTAEGKANMVFRTVDLWFVAHGDWDTLTSKKFGDRFSKPQPKPGQTGGALLKSGFLTEAETARRGLKTALAAGQEQRYFYTTFQLFDRVQVSVTRDAVLSRTPDAILLAARVDPRFAKDAEYPNQWQPIDRDAQGKPTLGAKQPYSGAGLYLKVTRLAEPAGAVFVEFHSTFHEPQGWFDGENLLRSKLPLIAQHQAEQFRGKWARASLEKDEKPAEK